MVLRCGHPSTVSPVQSRPVRICYILICIHYIRDVFILSEGRRINQSQFGVSRPFALRFIFLWTGRVTLCTLTWFFYIFDLFVFRFCLFVRCNHFVVFLIVYMHLLCYDDSFSLQKCEQKCHLTNVKRQTTLWHALSLHTHTHTRTLTYIYWQLYFMRTYLVYCICLEWGNKTADFCSHTRYMDWEFL